MDQREKEEEQGEMVSLGKRGYIVHIGTTGGLVDIKKGLPVCCIYEL